ncbi:MAG: hypothetical protein ACRDIB_16715 [Ardenticatenaceae bacterium]
MNNLDRAERGIAADVHPEGTRLRSRAGQAAHLFGFGRGGGRRGRAPLNPKLLGGDRMMFGLERTWLNMEES